MLAASVSVSATSARAWVSLVNRWALAGAALRGSARARVTPHLESNRSDSTVKESPRRLTEGIMAVIIMVGIITVVVVTAGIFVAVASSAGRIGGALK
jgi:hypothetical protein